MFRHRNNYKSCMSTDKYTTDQNKTVVARIVLHRWGMLMKKDNKSYLIGSKHCFYFSITTTI